MSLNDAKLIYSGSVKNIYEINKEELYFEFSR